jgi:type IV pilus assembly protein PilW
MVELMVGMVIALLATFVMMQVLVNSEAGRRATGGLSDSQTSGLIGLFSIERDLQQAGLGTAAPTTALGCRIRAAGGLNGKPMSTAMIVPAGAAPGSAENPWGIPQGDPNSDMIVIVYGSPASASEGTKLTSITSASPYRIETILGIANGEYMLIAEGGTDCTLGQVTATDPADASVSLNYGAGVSYTSTARAHSLGLNPRFVVYAVRNGSLTVCDFLVNDCSAAGSASDADVWVPVASDVVALAAQYGWDTSMVPDKAVDAYCKSRLTPAGAGCPLGDGGSPAAGHFGLSQNQRACDWRRVLSMRVAIVSRSGQYEKDEVSPASIKLWQDAVVAPTTTGPDFVPPDRHYRYRVANTTVALRNAIWMNVAGSTC